MIVTVTKNHSGQKPVLRPDFLHGLELKLVPVLCHPAVKEIAEPAGHIREPAHDLPAIADEPIDSQYSARADPEFPFGGLVVFDEYEAVQAAVGLQGAA